jgi:hypothetical protein
MRRYSASALTLALIALLVSTAFSSTQRRKGREEEPKSQVVPLPRELPTAIAADTSTLDFHVSPLLKTGGLAVQIRRSLTNLLRDTHGETVVKLRAFVSGVGDARRVLSEVTAIFTEKKLPLPVVTVIQIGRLSDDLAQVVIEAVVATQKNVNPNGLAFLAGQTGKTFTDALNGLRQSAAEASVSPDQVVSCTCFVSNLEGGGAQQSAIQTLFPKAVANVVQAVRDPIEQSTMCQGIGQLAHSPEQGPLVWLKKAHASQVNSPRLVFTGLQLSFGSYLDDAKEAFSRLQRTASALGSNAAPVQVNAFSLDLTAGAAIRKSTSFPPNTFTVQTVEGLPSVDATAGVEAVLAPEVPTPFVVDR